MAQRKQKTIAAHPGEILRTEFMEPMGITAYQLAKALHFPGIYEVVREQRAITGAPTRAGSALVGVDLRRRRSPPRQVLWHDVAVLDESSNRLRPAAGSSQRSLEQDQAEISGVRSAFPTHSHKPRMSGAPGEVSPLHRKCSELFPRLRFS